MKKSLTAVLLAGSLSLGACATTGDSDLAAVGSGAAVGAVGGAVVGGIVAGAPIEGALIGAAIGGIAGAIWADQDGDGRADGYYRDGRYYAGPPAGYVAGARRCPSVGGSALKGAGIGAAAGVGVGALTDVGILEGAIAGAVVGGIAGAIWADSNNDGCVDGYSRDGRYYQGVPSGYQAGSRAAERG
ncbi:hypothetical protein M9978_05025 [Sphingomonas sp. MG17]|jgi:hypothetical protein|uniref:Glycine zipper n=1 Tax=Sphingomonas tagetis TaxID=2949092 RepID=A0A9X2HHN5_9SPHN|nr:hypothetical protein [Sphingomonas tagetis]MCP3729787.1 hypothetical protein [Sphingomonas tagetis]